MMVKWLLSLFNLFPGEQRRALSVVLVGFLWSFAVTGALKFADALFLLHLGPSLLPNAYFVIACTTLLFAAVLLYLLGRFNPDIVFLTALLADALFYLGAFVFFFFNSDPVPAYFWFMLKVASALSFAVLVTCFWNFVDQYYHLQDAKRLFGLFSSSLFLGVASVGYVMHQGWLEVESFLPMISVFLSLAACVAWQIKHRFQAVTDEASAEQSQGDIEHSISYFFYGVLRSPITLLIVAGNLLTQLLMVLTEFNYLSYFDAMFDPGQGNVLVGEEGQAQLTLFLGQCLSYVSIGNLIMGLFIYGRLVRRVGIPNMMLITPVLLLICFGGQMASHQILFPLIGYVVVEGTLFVIDDCNFSLLLNVVPQKIKYKIRVAIESFFEPIGMLVSAILLSFPSLVSPWIGFILSFVLFCVAFSVRFAYSRALINNLSDLLIPFHKTASEWMKGLRKKDRSACERRLFAMLKQKDARMQLFACELLSSGEKAHILPRLLKIEQDLDPEGKLLFLRWLEDSPLKNEPSLVELVEDWSFHGNSSTLQNEASFFLAKKGLLSSEKAFIYTEAQEVRLQAVGILGLLTAPTVELMQATSHKAYALELLGEFIDSSEEEKVCFALQILGATKAVNDVRSIAVYLQDERMSVRYAAGKSLKEILEPKHSKEVNYLLDCLKSVSDFTTRQMTLQAIGQALEATHVPKLIETTCLSLPSEQRQVESMVKQLGLKAVPQIFKIIKDDKRQTEERLLASKILGYLALPQLRANLHEIVMHELDRVCFFAYHAKHIQNMNPDIDLTLLEKTLLATFESVIDFILQLLVVAGSLGEAELLSHSFKSRHWKVKSQAIESLEKACEPKIFSILKPLLMDGIDAQVVEKWGKDYSLDLESLLDVLSSSSSLGNKLVAITIQYQNKIPGWQNHLKNLMKREEPLFHHFAHELLEESA